MYLTKEQILSAQDFKYEEVQIPEWGGTVRVRGLTAYERDELEVQAMEAQKNPDAAKNVRARLVVKCLVDADGNRLFKDSDADALGTKHGAILDKLFWVTQRLSALTAQDIEDLEKNS